MEAEEAALALYITSCAALLLSRKNESEESEAEEIEKPINNSELSSPSTNTIEIDKPVKRKLVTRKRIVKKKKRIYSLAQTELMFEDPHGYRSFIRMKATEFEEVLALIAQDIKKEDTVMKQAIPPDKRLALTLRFLATGETFRSLIGPAQISEHAVGKIVPEVCAALIRRLGPIFLKEPQNSDEWLEVAEEFKTMWDYPHCLGAMDAKHLVFKTPEDESEIKSKKHNNIILLGICDANYKFIYVHLGVNGPVSDAGVWRNCSFYENLRYKDFPRPSNLPGSDIPIPYHLIAGNVFSLSQRLMKPYPEKWGDPACKYFNNRISRGIQVAGNSITVLTTRFRSLVAAINLGAKKAEDICMVSCILHNFLLSRYSYRYLDLGCLDRVQPFEALRPDIPNSTGVSLMMRNEIRDFFWRNRQVNDDFFPSH